MNSFEMLWDNTACNIMLVKLKLLKMFLRNITISFFFFIRKKLLFLASWPDDFMLCFTTLLISRKTVHSVDGRMTDK